MKKETMCLICDDMPTRGDANTSKHCKMCGLPVYDAFEILTENEKRFYFCCHKCKGHYQRISKNLHDKLTKGQISVNDVKILDKEILI